MPQIRFSVALVVLTSESSRGVRNAHQEFAKILPTQEADEGPRRFRKPLNHVFAILDPSLADPGGDIVHEIPIAPDKVGDNETANIHRGLGLIWGISVLIAKTN